MSNVVEDRIINLKFNNKDFEKNAAQSMKTIDQLEEKLSFKKIASSGANVFSKLLAANKTAFETTFAAMETIADKGTFGIVSKIKNAFSKNGDMFSPLLEMATGAFRKIGEDAYQLGKNVATSLTTEQISAGWEKYADKTRSVQTIMNATGKSIDVVTEALAKLNWYSDETSYSYTDMTSNIAKFTSSGVELDTAVTAMIGIGNAAGLAGASVQDASHAMAGFAKAIGQGYMDRQKWSWIETAQMDTQQFKKSLIEAAVALGELHSNGDGTYYSNAGKELTSLSNFENDMASGKWMTSAVMLKALEDYGALTNEVYDIYEMHNGEMTTSEILDEMGVSAENLGLKAFKASQEAKTFADAIDSVKDAVSTGWMTTFDTIFGNYEEAKTLWTDFANWLYDMFAESGNYRNEMLDIFMGRSAINEAEVKAGEEAEREYFKMGDEMISGREYLLQALYKFMDVISAYADAIKKAWDRTFGTWDYTTIAKIAKQIHRVAEILGATLEKDVMMDPRKVSELEWLDNKNRNSFITYFRLAMESFFRILKESVETIKVMGKTFYQALYDAFGNKSDYSHGFYISGFYKWFKDITTRVANFIKVFRQVITTNNRFKRIISGNLSVLKIFFKILQANFDFMIQNGGGVIALVAEFFATIGDFANAINTSSVYDFVMSLMPLISTLVEKVLNGILKIIMVVGKAKDFILQFITGLDKKVGETGALGKFTDSIKHLAKAISELLGLDELGDFLDSLGEAENAESFMDAIVEGADKAIGVLGGLFDFAAKGIEGVKKFGDTVSQVASDVGTSVGNIVGSLFGSKETTRGGMPGMDEKTSIFETIRLQASGMLTNLFSGVDNKEVTRGAGEYTGSILSGVIQGITTAINRLDEIGINWDNVKSLGIFAAFIITLININKDLAAVDKLLGHFTAIPDIFSSVNSTILSAKGVLDQIKKTLVTATEIQKLETIAKVISTLAMIVIILASIPEHDLAKGVTYLAIIAAIFVAFNKAMGAASSLINYNNTKNSVKIEKSFLSGNNVSWNAGPLGWAAVIISLASFVSSIVTAINTMTTVDGKDVAMAAGIILGIIGAMTLMLWVLGKLGAYFTQTATSEHNEDTTLSSGTNKKVTDKNRLSGPTGKFFYGIAAAMLALSIGIKIIVDAIKVLVDAFENNHTESVVSALLVVFGLYSAIILVVVGIMMKVEQWAKNAALGEDKMKTLGTTIVLIGAAVAIIAASISIVTWSVVALTAIFTLVKSPESVGLAMGTVLLIMAMMLGFIIWLMNTIKPLSVGQLKHLGKAMVLIGASIAIIAGSVSVVVLSIVLLIAALTIEGGILKVMGQENTITTAILSVIAIMGIMMIFIVSLIGVMRGMTKSEIAKLGGVVLKIAEAMIIIAAAMFVIAAAIALVAKSGAKTEHGIAVVLGMFTAFATLLAMIWATDKMSIGPKKVKQIAESFVYMAGAMALIGASLAVLTLSGADPLTLLKYVGIMALVVIALGGVAAGLGYLSSVVPIAVPVIQAFAIMMASMAGMMIGFAVGVATLTACLKPLTKALIPFKDALVDFLEGIEGHVWTLIPLAAAIGLFSAIMASIVIGIVVLIYTYRTQIAHGLSSMFTGIQHMFSAFGTWFAGLPAKTKTMIKAFAVAIGSGLLAATPEMYDMIESGFMILMERLGDSVGWITKGLLALVINIVNSLADAIRENSSTLAYAIYSAFESIGEVLLDLLTPLFSGIAAPIQALFSSVVKAFLKIGELKKRHGGIFNIWNASEEERALAEKEWQEFASKGFGGLYQEELGTWQSSYSDSAKSLKELMRIGMTSIADTYGIDPNERLKTLSQEAHDEAVANINKNSEDLKNTVQDKIGSVGDGAVSGIDSVYTKVSGYLSGKGIDTTSLVNKVKNGANFNDIIGAFMGTDGSIDMNALGDFQNVLNGEGLTDINYTQLASGIDTAGYSMENFTESAANNGDIIVLGDLMDKNTVATDDYSDSLDRATQSEQELADESENLEAVVSSKKQAFYDAGSDFASAVEEGFNADWTGISDNIRSKFKALADDIREMLEMKDVDLKVGIRSVTPVYDEGAEYTPTTAKDYNDYSYTWDPNAGNNAMQGDSRYGAPTSNQNGSYEAAQAAYGQLMAKNIQEQQSRSRANRDIYEENFTKIGKLYDEFHDYNTQFGQFSEGAQAFYNKDQAVYLDGEKVGNVMHDNIGDIAVNAITSKLGIIARSGG